ncbi:RNA methyltransferase [Anabaena cylindrica FACHB-243]|uniref:tRNA/rRNA methyltransferase (SpoU) n=1 Tax=Anabaena cylindrica (strain ATCC 27899 / PCC 7122) TaxID=272123 RepID=K9ZM17_ANACC|nr:MULTISPECIES: RNA methyltransferase [Anabaena]AFZ59829.1 tRNA/rRNA methyltransferase (SpoU) [Anabaena cylindrica PCC 7122]MBD2417228.1 RNA methyltransferase [Anabaena cylindrica FACHB-243]MBY5282312.1 RNA methyltransferase [Anabaena sp. CCAP 1446/1C]MBY5309762.1 RNA methyltransferase [Anabaena sp. CCAP 1446/1C]MCM2404956.1 RNA methyltransferase [Anabaena sp. CCAP 1446/1C]
MLTSLQNSLVKQIRKLHSTKERHKQELFLLEGTHLLEEAWAVNYPLEVVCCTPQWQMVHPQLWDDVCSRCHRYEIVSEEVLSAIATTVQPDGVVAIAKRAQQQTQVPFSGVVLAVETLQDPGNLGTMIRTAAAAGASGLWLSDDSVDLDNPKVLRASAGQWFRLNMAVSEDLRTTVKQVKQAGMQVVATLPDANLTYWEVDWRKPSLILLGNEGAGLSANLAAMADQQVKIPLSPGVESLNVAIAAALMLYEVQRQKIYG